jgi:hypothetical protein
MPDEEVKSILVSMGIYSLAMAYVGSESELFRMIRDDFETLKTICIKGA